MTSTVNGIGTHLSGSRELSDEEFNQWSEQMPYIHGLTKENLRIATKSFVFFFLPVIPFETVVYYHLGDKYLEVFYPAGKDGVYWKHVFNHPVFYVIPFLIILCLILYFA